MAVLSPEPIAEERETELTLRPRSLDQIIGQDHVKTLLATAIAAAKQRGEALTHQLFYGPPGTGKTTFANAIADAMGAQIRITSGPALRRAADLVLLVRSLSDGDVLFIDEIHRLPSVVEEVLYPVMEDFAVDLVSGTGSARRVLHVPVPHITVVGATTRLGSLTEPLRDRFGIIHRLQYYEEPVLELIVQRSARVIGQPIYESATAWIAQRARATPRIANRLYLRCRDAAEVKKVPIIDNNLVLDTMEMLGVDEKGLDALDREMLMRLARDYNGGPVGLRTLAALIGESVNTVEDSMEPYLMRIGLLARTPRGRMLTEAGRAYTR